MSDVSNILGYSQRRKMLDRMPSGPECFTCGGRLGNSSCSKCMHCGQSIRWVRGTACKPGDELGLQVGFAFDDFEKVVKGIRLCKGSLIVGVLFLIAAAAVCTPLYQSARIEEDMAAVYIFGFLLGVPGLALCGGGLAWPIYLDQRATAARELTALGYPPDPIKPKKKKKKNSSKKETFASDQPAELVNQNTPNKSKTRAKTGVKANCPHCGSLSTFPVHARGKLCNCGACRKQFRIASGNASKNSFSPLEPTGPQMLQITCPACQTKLQVKPDAKGSVAKCSLCGTRMQIT